MGTISLVQPIIIKEDFYCPFQTYAWNSDNNLGVPFGSRKEPISPVKATITFVLNEPTTSINYWEIMTTLTQPGKTGIPLVCGDTKNLPSGETLKEFPINYQVLDPFSKVFFGARKVGSPGAIVFTLLRFSYLA